MKKHDLGAQGATAVATAGSSDTPQLSHVVPFPAPTESDDERELAEAFDRERDMEARAESIAELLYNSRCFYIGGGMPWGLMTPGQRLGYIREALSLIRGF